MNTTLSNGMSLAVTVGGKDLITSGIVHLDQPEFKITIGGLVVLFRFKTEKDSPAKYVGTVVGGKLELELINHNNSIGDGFFTPIEIGKLGNKKLYITYVVHTLNAADNQRSVQFALYLESVQ